MVQSSRVWRRWRPVHKSRILPHAPPREYIAGPFWADAHTEVDALTKVKINARPARHGDSLRRDDGAIYAVGEAVRRRREWPAARPLVLVSPLRLAGRDSDPRSAAR